MLRPRMFGIGAGEMLVVAIIVLLAVGPKSMPKFMATIGKTMRELRRASTELRRQSGIDELMRDDPLGARRLAQDIQRAPAPRREPQRLTPEDLAKEDPPEGPDIAHARLGAPATPEAAQPVAREHDVAEEPAPPVARPHDVAREPDLADEPEQPVARGPDVARGHDAPDEPEKPA